MTLFLGRQQCINYHSTAYFQKKTDDIIVDVSTLKTGDRIGDMATVLGYITDNNGQKYIIAVLDAKYRNIASWSEILDNTELQDYASAPTSGRSEDSASTSMDIMINSNNDNLSYYPAFREAKDANQIIINGKTYHSLLPNVAELNMIRMYHANLEYFDPTVNDWTQYKLSDWSFGGTGGAWACTEANIENAYIVTSNGPTAISKYEMFGIIPIFEIPL